MEKKKNAGYDLERKRFGFFHIGLIVAMGLTLAAFEWTTFEEADVISVLGPDVMDPIEEERPPITRPQLPKPIETRPVNVELPPEIGEPDPITPPDPVPTIDSSFLSLEVDPDMDIEDFDPEPFVDDTPYVIVEDMPHWKTEKILSKDERKTFTDTEIFKFLKKNVKYPQMAKDAGIKGTVYVQYIINRQGNVDQIEVVRGVHPSLDKEAIRVVKRLPQFVPGKQRGLPVNVKFTLPIKFTLIN